jgi:signal transduction histidine kinase
MPFVSRTLRLKISLGVSLALVILLAPLNWVQYELQRRTAMRELELLAIATGTIVEHSLEEAMLANNQRAIQGIIDSVAQAPEIQAIYLLDTEGRVAASPGGLHNGERRQETDSTCAVCHQFTVENRPRGLAMIAADGQPVFRTMTPVLNRPSCHRCHAPEDRLNGVFYMDFSMAGLNTRLEQGLRTAFFGSVTIIMLTAAVLYLLLSWLIITPLERVAQVMRRFSQGTRQVRVPVQSEDEVGLLAGVFNEMADTIQFQDAEANKLYAELEGKDADRRRLLARLIDAREEEHRRLARRIHDSLGQLLTGLSLNLKLCQQAIPENFTEVHHQLTRLNGLARHTIEQAHHLITQLRPSVLDDYGLVPAIQEEVAQQLRESGIQAHVENSGRVDDLPTPVATATFRIVQEAITNVLRHANATQIWISLQCEDGALLVTIEDDGAGLKEGNHYRGLGILGMEERAGALGGQVAVTARQPHGTRVAVRLPMKEGDV